MILRHNKNGCMQELKHLLKWHKDNTAYYLCTLYIIIEYVCNVLNPKPENHLIVHILELRDKKRGGKHLRDDFELFISRSKSDR